MAKLYNTPHTVWQNQESSYWIPIQIMARAYGVIMTSATAAMKIGKKWVGIDVTSERVE